MSNFEFGICFNLCNRLDNRITVNQFRFDKDEVKGSITYLFESLLQKLKRNDVNK